MQIGVLALQGDVREHESILTSLSVTTLRVRVPDDLENIDALILPGGESTTMSMLLDSSGLRPDVVKWIEQGNPTLGTCAGLVLLAESISDGRPDQEVLGGLSIKVQRNGYGRQRFSFEAPVDAPLLGEPFDAVFIRAPRILSVDDNVEVLGRLGGLEGEPVLCQQGSILGCAFHPELSGDPRLHQRLIELVTTHNNPG